MKNYEPDDGPLNNDQIEQIRNKAKQADEIELLDFVRLAILEEREACAKVAEQVGQHKNQHGIAAAIRARGQS